MMVHFVTENAKPDGTLEKQGLTRPVPGHLAKCTVALGKEQRSDMVWVLMDSFWLLFYV